MSVPRMLEIVKMHRAVISDENGEFVTACQNRELREEISHRYNNHLALVESLADLLDPKIDTYKCEESLVRSCKCRVCSVTRARVTLHTAERRGTIVLRQNR
jgi:two-component sensor histidine kinase